MTSGDTAGGWHRVEALVGDALEQEPARRAAFLDAACSGDAALRREVDSLLAAHDRSGAFDALAADIAPLAARLRGPEAARFSSRSVGRYRLGAHVAGGGMGVVYEAIDEPLGRRVALKFLRERLDADDSAAERFRREARVVAALEHPNICTVHEIGESADGRLFIAMPLYDGETLQRRIARGPLAVEDAVAIAAQVARGLAKAHGAGVVHRDVKPSNVFVTTDGVVKLLDFGIAKLMDAAVTGTGGGPLGTVAYMSPEQALGGTVDHRSDVWSLGVVLYEMLAGQRPFAGDAPVLVLEAIAHRQPAPLTRYRADVPPALARIVDAALAKSPDDRCQSARAIERDLLALGVASGAVGSLVDSTGPGATPDATPDASTPRWRAPRWPASRRLVGTALAASLVVASVVGFLVWRGRAAPAAGTASDASVVVLPFTGVAADSGTALVGDDITSQVIARLSTVPELKVISRTSAMHYKGSTAALRTIASELAVANVLTGSVSRDEGRVRVAVQLVDARAGRRLWAARYELEPRDPFRAQEQIATQVVRALGVRLADGDRARLERRGTASAEAEELYRRGRYLWERRTPTDHVKAIEYFERAIAVDSGFADAYAALADAYLTGYQLEMSPLPEAEAYARHKWAAERALALDDRSAAAHVSFAVSLWWQRNWPGAERELRRSIELQPGIAHTHYWYALLLGGEGRLDEAVRETRIAAGLDPFAVVSQLNAGWACELAGNFACAIEARSRALELSPNWGLSHAWLGIAYSYAGRHDDALRELRLALTLDPQSPEAVATFAAVLAGAGRTAEARRELARARARGAPPITMARAYVALGEADSAFAWLDRTDWTWPNRATRTDAGLAPLRADPRFARLWARVDREMGLR